MNNESCLRRMPNWAFLLTCIIASGVGLIGFAVLGAAISDLAKTSSSVIVVLALVGLVGPTTWLISIRRRQFKKQQSSDVRARITPTTVITGALIGAAYFIVTTFIIPSHDPLGVIVRLEEEGHIKGVTITNIKSAPLRILKAAINDRDDCLINPLAPERELKEGDQSLLITACAVLRVVLTTSRGTATYTFK